MLYMYQRIVPPGPPNEEEQVGLGDWNSSWGAGPGWYTPQLGSWSVTRGASSLSFLPCQLSHSKAPPDSAPEQAL